MCVCVHCGVFKIITDTVIVFRERKLNTGMIISVTSATADEIKHNYDEHMILV